MKGADLTDARERLGRLWGLDRPVTMAELGRVLRFPGRDPGRRIMDYEHGRRAVPPAVAVAVEMMLNGAKPEDR